MKRRRLKPREVATIIARSLRGESSRVLGADFGVSHVAVQKHVRRFRLTVWLEANAKSDAQKELAPQLIVEVMRGTISVADAKRQLQEVRGAR